MERAGDDAHLFLASQSGWTLITHNAKDFILLHEAWLRWSKGWEVSAQHSGILILIPPISPVAAAQEIERLIQRDVPLVNQVYIWRRSTGWISHR